MRTTRIIPLAAIAAGLAHPCTLRAQVGEDTDPYSSRVARERQTEDEGLSDRSGDSTGPALEPPILIRYIEAPYPPDALAQGLEAEVIALLDVGENGLVTKVEIQKGAGQGFDEAAAAAMAQFIFEPARRDGEPIASRVVYRYTFFIQEKVDGSGGPSAAEGAETEAATLTGVVTDMDDVSLPGATLVLVPLAPPDPRGEDTTGFSVEPVTAAANGAFVLAELRPGAYQVDVALPGYEPLSAVETLAPGETREVRYRLELEAAMYETVVRGRRPPREVTRREITRREITRIPGTGGDALRSVQNMPGMARAPGISGSLIVRGSSPGDSRFFFDTHPVPLLYHFGGLTSVINSDLLERIDFFPGNYSVRYGGATGGIVEVTPRAPKTDRLHGYVDADVFDISALVETPINEDWSVAVSARRSYIDGIINLAMPDSEGLSFTVAPRYYDYQLIADYHPSPKTNLRLFAYGSDDRLVLVTGDTAGENPNFTGNVAVALSFHQLQARLDTAITDDVSNSLNVAVGYQFSRSSFGDLFQFDLDSVPIYLRDELELDLDDAFTLRTGLDSEVDYAKYAIRAPDVIPMEGEPMDPLSSNTDTLEVRGKDWFVRPGWYAEAEVRPIPSLRLINGLRLDYYQRLEELAVDPRFATRFEVVPGTVIKGGVGLFHQPPDEASSEPPFGNPDIGLITAIHYSAGVEQKLAENVEVGLEGFYKDISGLVVSSDEMVERSGKIVEERFNNDGTGRVYGLEFLLKHRPTDRFFGWISYTLMRSSRVDHPGERARLFDFDQTHILTAVASAVLGRGWEAGIRFRLVSGNPITPVVAAVYDGDSDIYYPIYGRTNSDRLPMFHQLDLRIDKTWNLKALELAVYVDVQNVYNHRNPEGYDYLYDYSQRRYFFGLPLIPSFGFKLEY